MQVEESDEGSISINDLPSCIMIEILSRLPLKTVFDSRCVSKLWNQYVLDPSFSACYAANGPTKLLIPTDHRTPNTFWLVDCDSQHYCPPRKVNIGVDGNGSGLPSILTKHPSTIWVGSFCNGFLCLCDDKVGNPVILCNPLLPDHYFTLPEVTGASHIQYSSSVVSSRVISGLGFADKRYKVVRIFEPKSSSWEAEITTVGTDTCWRNIGKVPYGLRSSSRFCSTNFNGVLHWNIEGHASELIYCLHVRDEKFSCLPPPPIFSPKKRRAAAYDWSNIGIFEDSLYISARDASELEPPVQVWLMKEYGVKESWIRIFNIKSPCIEWWNPYRRFQLIKLLSDGNMLVLCSNNSLFRCNIRDQITDKKVFWFSSNKTLLVAVSPSFASLKNVAYCRDSEAMLIRT